MKQHWSIGLLLIGALAVKAAHAGEPHPGTYIDRGGWGNLVISQSGETTKFTLGTVGANGHTCELEGSIVQSKAVLKGNGDESTCTVLFTTGAGSIAVTTKGEPACRSFCGARAGFTGIYLVPPPNCTPKAKAATRRRFDNLYRAKSYEQAIATLAPVLSECSETLGWLEADRIRNDLAIAQFHAGRSEDCLTTLKPVLEMATDSEEGLSNKLPPSDFDSYLPIAKAAWTNVRLCSKK